MRIDVEIQGLESLSQELAGYSGRIKDLTPALEVVADDFLALEERVFETDGASLGSRWPELSTRWAAYKAQHYPQAGMLELDGRLRRSLTQRGAAYQRREIRPAEALLGTSVGIAAIHQRGATLTLTKPYPRTVRIPRRSFVGIRPTDSRRWSDYLGEYVVDGSVRRTPVGL